MNKIDEIKNSLMKSWLNHEFVVPCQKSNKDSLDGKTKTGSKQIILTYVNPLDLLNRHSHTSYMFQKSEHIRRFVSKAKNELVNTLNRSFKHSFGFHVTIYIIGTECMYIIFISCSLYIKNKVDSRYIEIVCLVPTESGENWMDIENYCREH